MPLSDSGSSPRASGTSGSARLKRALLVAIPGALALTPLTSFALFDDKVEVFAAENVTWDDNVFRLSKDLGPVVSDTISTTSLGFNANVPYSLQKFQLAYTYFATRYDKSSELNFNGYTGHAGWLWSITPRATGDIGYDETRTLASFSQYVGGDRTRDVLTSRLAYANGAWFTTPSWRLHGAVGASEQKHDDPARKLYDLRTANAEVGESYVTAQDNRVGLALRMERGDSFDANPAAGIPDFSYQQWGGGLVVHYAITGHSMLDGRLEYTHRDYDTDAFGSFSGPTVRFTDTWNPTVKTQVVTTLRREISPIQEIQSSNFVIVKGVSVKPQWLATEKITVGADLEYNDYQYKGAVVIPVSGGPIPAVPVGDYSNRVRTIGLTGSWRPTKSLFFVASYLHEYRTSTLPLQDYKVDVFSLEGRFSF